MVMFYGDENSTYRLLIKEPDIWLINVNGESAPISVSKEVLGQMNEVPADSVIPPYTPPKWIRKEGERRIEIIKPLMALRMTTKVFMSLAQGLTKKCLFLKTCITKSRTCQT